MFDDMEKEGREKKIKFKIRVACSSVRSLLECTVVELHGRDLGYFLVI